VPITSCGRFVTAAIWSTSSVDVFDARIAPGFATASSLRNVSCLTSIRSNTASMMMSASFAAFKSSDGVIRLMFLSIASCLRRPFDTVAA
jgi:hypothetical protein